MTPQSADATGAADAHELVTRAPQRLTPDPGRVIAKLFVPGEEVPEHESRTARVIARVLALGDSEAGAALSATLASFATRHRDLRGTFADHFETVAHRIPRAVAVSGPRRLLIGSYFTHEYAIEGAALCNPCMVAHPDQSGLGPDQVRFVLSARAIGEGHLSCIELRTGVAGPGGRIDLDAPAPYAGLGRVRPPQYDLRQFEAVLSATGDDDEVAAFLHRHLPRRFAAAELEQTLEQLPARLTARQGTHRTIERIRWIAASTYDLEFSPDTAISERVLWPNAPTERHGMEDARFVRFTDDDGTNSYYATYTAFDGASVTPQRLHTTDFRRFQITQLTGPAALNKGMAFFPRRVGGMYMALSRWDRESTSIATSPDNQTWSVGATVHAPGRAWELTQVGNCGSPIETADGWLVLTHGVGPMRTYSIGALLLDLDQPDRVLASLPEPLMTAASAERDGYVPNVLYSCGAMRHRDTLVIPYGTSDTAIAFATVSLPALLDRMRHTRSDAASRGGT
ncbi:glycoside hydrolase family 130 protein [Actinocrinis puniceicyclus]|uniref:Glycoside hydrolase family 130 protein n=1 Tax=Actinocrinis puniceicyclus TaxID=977794 RepID=A0A8J7WH17_9ACTN|nr:glycoside hydrolase family 130 protein [Actinocrinis puniceicyclus]MBS2962038.1 glycoside hydrolase family 130 protein [Actinocrinis puniceicyclus]